MSLRPKHSSSSRSRSKSPSVSSRKRASSSVTPASTSSATASIVSAAPAAAYAYPPGFATVATAGYNNHAGAAGAMQYEIRSPQSSAATPAVAAGAQAYATPESYLTGSGGGGGDEQFTMGDYKDLPPHERPGYAQQQQQASAFQQYQQTSQGQNQAQMYQTDGSQWNYTAQPQTAGTTGATTAGTAAAATAAGSSGAAVRHVMPGSFNYAQAPMKISYTAKPQTKPTSVVQQEEEKRRQQYLQYQQYEQQQAAYKEYQQKQLEQQQQLQQQQQQQKEQQKREQRQQRELREQQQRDQQRQEAETQRGYAGSRSGKKGKDKASASSAAQKYQPHQQYQQQVQWEQDQQRQPYGHHQQGSPQPYGGANVVEIVPGGGLGRMASPPSPGLRPHRMSSAGGSRPDLYGQPGIGAAGEGLTQRMERLSVSGNRPDVHQILMPGQMPPASPFLEPYQGTYQSISPMPSPIMMPAAGGDFDDLPPLTPTMSGGYGGYNSGGGGGYGDDRMALALTKTSSRSSGKSGTSSSKKRVKIYDASEDAEALVAALSAKQVDPDPIIDILPALNHDQILELRNEYKKHCKIQGRGINVAKHIKLKTSGNFGKAAYVTALGRWESEAYWANFWYQQQSAKRELLIEALMGRGNAEVREIKAAFRDKRYGDNLVRCMEKELRADKFRNAVLLALEARRQEETEVWSVEQRNRDVDALATLLKRGGESEMIKLVVLRSESHLREVLRTYERKYQENFARSALKRSNNLVGELLAHILNGVINKPARDAMLLHHAITDLSQTPPSSSNPDPARAKHERQQRYELLISRLVRLHWDRLHLLRVKDEYREKYGRYCEDDLEDALRGDLLEFSLALCATK